MTSHDFVARCPACGCVSDHQAEGHLYRCATCHTRQDLLAGLA